MSEWVLIGSIFVNVILAVLWLVREFYFARTFERFSSGVSALPQAVAMLDRSITSMTSDISRLQNLNKDGLRDLTDEVKECKRLVLDVETRISGLVRDVAHNQRERGDIHIANSDRGQINQGKGFQS